MVMMMIDDDYEAEVFTTGCCGFGDVKVLTVIFVDGPSFVGVFPRSAFEGVFPNCVFFVKDGNKKTAGFLQRKNER